MREKDLMEGDEKIVGAETLRFTADRVLFMDEYAVAYEEPVDPLDAENTGPRGYLTVWVREKGREAPYNRVQGMSGNDTMVRRYFAEMASNGSQRIEAFIG